MATFRALDGTLFTDVDTQNPATEVIFNELTAQAAHDDESLLQTAYEQILFQPQDGIAAISPPTQFKVYLTPVEINGRWRSRFGKIDFVDTPVVTSKKVPKPLPTADLAACTPAISSLDGNS